TLPPGAVDAEGLVGADAFFDHGGGEAVRCASVGIWHTRSSSLGVAPSGDGGRAVRSVARSMPAGCGPSTVLEERNLRGHRSGPSRTTEEYRALHWRPHST